MPRKKGRTYTRRKGGGYRGLTINNDDIARMLKIASFISSSSEVRRSWHESYESIPQGIGHLAQDILDWYFAVMNLAKKRRDVDTLSITKMLLEDNELPRVTGGPIMISEYDWSYLLERTDWRIHKGLVHQLFVSGEVSYEGRKVPVDFRDMDLSHEAAHLEMGWKNDSPMIVYKDEFWTRYDLFETVTKRNGEPLQDGDVFHLGPSTVTFEGPGEYSPNGRLSVKTDVEVYIDIQGSEEELFERYHPEDLSYSVTKQLGLDFGMLIRNNTGSDEGVVLDLEDVVDAISSVNEFVSLPVVITHELRKFPVSTNVYLSDRSRDLLNSSMLKDEMGILRLKDIFLWLEKKIDEEKN